MAKKKVPASKKYADGTTYRTPSGEKKRRVSSAGTKRGDAFCARTNNSSYKTEKGRVRRKAWGCKGSKSVKK